MAPPPDSNHPAERARIEVGIVDGIGRIDAAEWDALCPPDDPFIRHAFLACLEDSGSASAEGRSTCGGEQLRSPFPARAGTRTLNVCAAL